MFRELTNRWLVALDWKIRHSDGGLPRSAVVGVLGGGQLGRMLATAAMPLGVKVKVLDPSDPAPASAAAEQEVGSFRDPQAIKRFAQGCDILTVEIEHVDTNALEEVQRETGVDIEPTPQTISIIQDKLVQKQHFAQAGVPVADFREVTEDTVASIQEEFGFPLMLKSRRLAYDGRGNAVAKDASEVETALESLGGISNGLYAEKWAPFTNELAVMVARSRDGQIVSFPVTETTHQDNICHTTETPAQVPPRAKSAALAVAERAISSLDGAGIFGVELFLMEDGTVLLNEVAPRPHNSGHYTIEACATSQYAQHLRAILGWPLGDASLLCGAAGMLNILGEADGNEGMETCHKLIGRALVTPGCSPHWYGKADVKKQRKVGHITVTGPDMATVRQRIGALQAEASNTESSSSERIAQVGIIMGSDSDLFVMGAAAEVLEEFGVPFEVTVVSAHRTPERMVEYARSAHKRGLKAIIAGAGGAAHLPGMTASMTPLPVIGVPVIPRGAPLDGMDALMSIVQMPRGVPVATVSIGNATNAALLALRILSAGDPVLLDKMLLYQDKMTESVMSKASRLEAEGWRGYEYKG
uniref:phosphoribosylaminoimidazole carboxylase n=1 Tax=Picocystis salinarum TaxID=88271 RepID=A0A7S3XCK2_9CHLO|mmetsp:Transcript_8425/g.52679  ORF Transcript_8425/g.52679 Transcript_8425/m.52679 type:complete len:586 (+) Transcript_8425:446-2203(+)